MPSRPVKSRRAQGCCIFQARGAGRLIKKKALLFLASLIHLNFEHLVAVNDTERANINGVIMIITVMLSVTVCSKTTARETDLDLTKL